MCSIWFHFYHYHILFLGSTFVSVGQFSFSYPLLGLSRETRRLQNYMFNRCTVTSPKDFERCDVIGYWWWCSRSDFWIELAAFYPFILPSARCINSSCFTSSSKLVIFSVFKLFHFILKVWFNYFICKVLILCIGSHYSS